MSDVQSGSGSSVSAGLVVLTEAQAGHLRAAKSQMDLLMQTRQVDEGMVYLIAMLQHLRAVFASME